MRLLIEYGGADTSGTNNYEQTPLHIAARMGHLEVVKLLLEHRGGGVHAVDRFGATPADLAVRHRRGEWQAVSAALLATAPLAAGDTDGGV